MAHNCARMSASPQRRVQPSHSREARRGCCRAVYQLFQKQMELGRLQLPDEEELQPQPQPEEEADPDLIARLVGAAGPPANEEEADASGIKKERLQVGSLEWLLSTASVVAGGPVYLWSESGLF